MFGENIIIGHSVAKIDNKNRVFLPSFTKATHKDKIIIERTEYKSDFALKLHAYHKYYELIERIKKLQSTATTLEEFMKFQERIESLCLFLAAAVNVDSQRRIVIPNHIFQELNWSSELPVILDGLGDSLLMTQQKK